MSYYNLQTMDVRDIQTGETYFLTGDIQNGNFVTHEEVTRKVTRITDTHIYCECGRRFIINKNLTIYIPYRRKQLQI